MKNDDAHFNNCLLFTYNPDRVVRKGTLCDQRIYDPWSRLQIYFIGLLPRTKRGNHYWLVVIDSFTKWVEALPTKNYTALTTARVLIDQIFTR